MIRQFRVPRPLGLSPSGYGSQPPGPLKFVPGVPAAPGQVAQTIKEAGMPPPLPDWLATIEVANDVHWKAHAEGTPVLEDVK